MSSASRSRIDAKLCTSVSARSVRGLASRAERAFALGSDLVEFRIDGLAEAALPDDLETKLSGFAKRAIFTVRSRREGGRFEGSEKARLELLSRLAEMRPAYLDIELASARQNAKWLESLPRGVQRIVSWHDFERTPALKKLRSTCKEELDLGSLAKIVTTARTVEDNLTTLALCRDAPGMVISFCMGELGIVSRVVSMRLGAPVAYASLPDEAVAPGQLSVSEMRTLREMVE